VLTTLSPLRPSLHPLAVALALVATAAVASATGCAAGYGEPDGACTSASAVLAECGMHPETSPFGTCRDEQRAQAEELVALHRERGCSGLTDARSDGFTCEYLPFLCVEHTVEELLPFVTDGCSMFPDGVTGDQTRWLQCCIEHDFAYYGGGPEAARLAADRALEQCIAATCGGNVLSQAMYAGVRVGGTPAIDTPWRWGYGWRYDPLDGYRELPSDQRAAVDAQIRAYRSSPIAPASYESRVNGYLIGIGIVPDLAASVEDVAGATPICDGPRARPR
jgi:hypothetical protein